jgi:hypothetical protein
MGGQLAEPLTDDEVEWLDAVSGNVGPRALAQLREVLADLLDL